LSNDLIGGSAAWFGDHIVETENAIASRICNKEDSSERIDPKGIRGTKSRSSTGKGIINSKGGICWSTINFGLSTQETINQWTLVRNIEVSNKIKSDTKWE